MRICLVTETFPPEINGVALTLAAFYRELKALGHEVFLVRPAQENEKQGETNDGMLLVNSTGLPKYPGLRVGFPAGGKMKSFWKKHQPDAIYVATEGPLGWSAVETGRKMGLPVATGFHTRFDDYMHRYGVPMFAPLASRWMRRFHNRARATLVPTKALANELTERGFHNACVLSRAVDTERFHPSHRSQALRKSWGVENGNLVVLHVGRLAPEKNLDLATRAYRAIAKRVDDTRFVVVGDGPSKARMADANPDFIFTGLKTGHDLAEHYASADMFLFPSQTETFGNVTVESMASGVPVVAYDYAAAAEHLSEACGFRVPMDDEHAFVDASVKLASDDALRTSMGVAARSNVERLRPSAVAEALANILTDIQQQREAA